MTLAPIETTGRRSEAAPSRVLLNCDKSGSWTVSKQNGRRRQFPNFNSALDSVRNAAGRNVPAIEIWQDGEYICCLSSGQRQDPRVSIEGIPTDAAGHVSSAEPLLNRATRVLMRPAGPLLWLALVLMLVATSLGWRLLLL
jgi:hypothetical protein